MTESEQMEFCGHLCMAARRLQIYLSREIRGGGYSFMFGDMAGGRFISGRDKPNQKDALFDACQELQKYLCAPA